MMFWVRSSPVILRPCTSKAKRTHRAQTEVKVGKPAVLLAGVFTRIGEERDSITYSTS
jgi:hypothetical protein